MAVMGVSPFTSNLANVAIKSVSAPGKSHYYPGSGNRPCSNGAVLKGAAHHDTNRPKRGGGKSGCFHFFLAAPIAAKTGNQLSLMDRKGITFDGTPLMVTIPT